MRCPFKLAAGNTAFSTCPFVRPFLHIVNALYLENELTDFNANWRKWPAGQGHETANFGGSEGQRS